MHNPNSRIHKFSLKHFDLVKRAVTVTAPLLQNLPMRGMKHDRNTAGNAQKDPHFMRLKTVIVEISARLGTPSARR